MRTRLFKILLLLLMPVLAVASDAGFFGQIESKKNAGKISAGEAALLKIQALKDRQALPAKYLKDAPLFTRQGLRIIAEAKAVLPTLTGTEKLQLQQYLDRPSKEKLPESYISPSGRFKIHYSLEGADKADPYFVEQVAQFFDYAYDVEIGQLGYDVPPSDMGVDGPEWDIYMHNISDYGYTTYENPIPETPWPDYTGYVEMDNDFTHTPTKGLPGARVTAAHEFFHLIHLGYRSYNTPLIDSYFLYEASSTWMEDVVYDDINDYYNYLPALFGKPTEPFNLANGNHEYGLSVFFHMIEKKYGPIAVRDIWEAFRWNETFDALDQAFVKRNSSLDIELVEFAIWNLFTGDRADTVSFYPEGKNYPQIEAKQSELLSNKLTLSGSNRDLAFDYRLVEPQQTADYAVWPIFEDPYDWMFGVVVFPPAGKTSYFYSSGNSQREIPSLPSLSDVWIVPANLKVPTSNHSSRERAYQIEVVKGDAVKIEDQFVAVLPSPFRYSANNLMEFRFKLSVPAEQVVLKIMTERGQLVYEKKMGRRPDGDNKCVWNGLTANGQPLASGIYLVLIEAENILKPGKFAVIH